MTKERIDNKPNTLASTGLEKIVNDIDLILYVFLDTMKRCMLLAINMENQQWWLIPQHSGLPFLSLLQGHHFKVLHYSQNQIGETEILLLILMKALKQSIMKKKIESKIVVDLEQIQIFLMELDGFLKRIFTLTW